MLPEVGAVSRADRPVHVGPGHVLRRGLLHLPPRRVHLAALAVVAPEAVLEHADATRALAHPGFEDDQFLLIRARTSAVALTMIVSGRTAVHPASPFDRCRPVSTQARRTTAFTPSSKADDRCGSRFAVGSLIRSERGHGGCRGSPASGYAMFSKFECLRAPTASGWTDFKTYDTGFAPPQGGGAHHSSTQRCDRDR